MNNQTYSEVLTDSLIKLGEAMQVFANAIKEQFDHIKEFIEEHKDLLFFEDKPSWDVPKNLLRKSQVLNRKPVMIRARSYC